MKQLLAEHTSRLVSMLCIVSFLFLLPVSVVAQVNQHAGTQRIRFKIGAISAQVLGQFNTAQPRPHYLIKANAGDHMVVNVIPITRGLTLGGTVTSPSGKGDGQPGGIIFNGDLTENGDYTIELSQHTMGSNYKSGSFIVEVVITPAWLKN